MGTLERGADSAAASTPAGGLGAGYPALAQEDANSRLVRVGQMHMGEFVNRMHRATLVEHPVAVLDGAATASGTPSAEDASHMPLKQVVWASVDGAIGIMASLRDEQEFARLSIIQYVI